MYFYRLAVNKSC